MPPLDEIVATLPDRVVNELAILEDRAIRAEQELAHKTERLEVLQAEFAKLHEEVETLRALAKEIQEAANYLAIVAGNWDSKIEEELRRLLVLQAS